MYEEIERLVPGPEHDRQRAALKAAGRKLASHHRRMLALMFPAADGRPRMWDRKGWRKRARPRKKRRPMPRNMGFTR